MRKRKDPPQPQEARRPQILKFVQVGEIIDHLYVSADCGIPAFAKLYALNVRLAFYLTYLPFIESKTFEEYVSQVDLRLVIS